MFKHDDNTKGSDEQRRTCDKRQSLLVGQWVEESKPPDMPKNPETPKPNAYMTLNLSPAVRYTQSPDPPQHSTNLRLKTHLTPHKSLTLNLQTLLQP